MPRPICLYHRNCLDGSAAAAVIALLEPTCEFLPVQYGSPPPRVEGRNLFVVDFGFPIEQMRSLRAQAREVVWIDHHASQVGTQQTLGWGVVDTNECAASLAWRTLFPGKPEPPVIAYVRDKDLWKWELPASRAIAAGLMRQFAQSKFQGILESDLKEMQRIGEPLLAATMERVAKTASHGIAVDAPYGIPARRALVVPCPHDLSDLGDHVCLPSERGGLGFDLAILVYRKPDGAWVHSLRSNGTVDCGKIADARNGGGHPSSACYLSPVPFLESADCPTAFRRAPGSISSGA